MTYHSPLSASSMERWTNCPGSFKLIQSMPKGAPSSSKYSAKGSLLHEIAAGVKYNTPSVLYEGYEIEITEDMTNAIQNYIDYTNSVSGNDSNPLAYFSAKELQFSLPYIHPHFSGTIDYISVVGQTLHCIDLKTGSKKVEVENNLQLQYYALGAFYLLRDRGIIGNQGGPYESSNMEILIRRTGRTRPVITTVVLGIFQANDKGTDIRTIRVPITRIIGTFMELLLEAMRKCEDPDSKLVENPGCFFCPANSICPVQTKKREPVFPVWKGE